ncbi:MAG: hypothetical protein JJU36_13490 [Phycisphaeraceae bacterium]|nr:hypothetical protein [Phycisphaeraceae bacterium]
MFKSLRMRRNDRTHLVRGGWMLLAVFVVSVLFPVVVSAAEEGVTLIQDHTPWRFWLVLEPRDGGHTPSPADNWHEADFDDSVWGRFSTDRENFLSSTSRAAGDRRGWRQLYLRSRFGVADPTEVTDLKLSVKFRGQAVIHVNGHEIANHGQGGGVQTLDVAVPRDVLRKGGNTLAIKLRNDRANVAFDEIALTSQSGRGVIAYKEALKDVRLWNALPFDTITSDTSRGAPFRATWNVKHVAVSPIGLDHANPFDPLRPMRMVAPRGGSASGQVVLSGPGPLGEVRASLGTLRGPDGARIPADALEIRYAAEQQGARFFDALMAEPDETASIQPVWVLVDVPREQRPGWYTGELKVAGGGKQFTVPVQLLVSAWTLPEQAKRRTWGGVLHSPDTIALQHDVQPLSDEHFEKMESTIRMLGQIGNNVLYIPVIHHTHMGHQTGLVRFVEGENGYKPEFSALKRYFDMWEKHAGEPDVICLIVWKPQFGSRALFRGAQRQDEEPIMVTRLDPATGRMTPMRAPIYGDGEFETPEHLGRGLVPKTPADENAGPFWKALIDGTRAVVRERGWKEESLMLGQGFDSRPLREQVDFFNRIAPGIRWVIFSHWIRDPGPEDGRLVVSDGMEVGYAETFGRPSAPELTDEWPDVEPREYFVGGANRSDVLSWSGPTSYRNLGVQGNVARIGLDFWRVTRPDGSQGNLFNASISGAWLYKSNPMDVLAPGPDGAVPTVRFLNLREGLEETEVRIFLTARLHQLDEDKKQRIQALMEQRRHSWHMANIGMGQMRLSLDWQGLTAAKMAAAAELSGESEAGSWDSPPQP